MKTKPTYSQSHSPLFRIARRVVLTFVLFAMCGASSASAGVMYEFVQKDTNAILANLTFDSIPAIGATHENVEIFVLTQAGEDIFVSMEPTYLGTDFLGTTPPGFGTVVIVDLGMGAGPVELGSNFIATEFEASISAAAGNQLTDKLTLSFGNEAFFAFDTITYADENGPIDAVTGNWILVNAVPEPSSAALWGTLTVLGMCGRTRRRRKNQAAIVE